MLAPGATARVPLGGLSCKLLDVSKLSDLGWSAFIPLDDGIAGTYDCFLEQHGAARGP